MRYPSILSRWQSRKNLKIESLTMGNSKLARGRHTTNIISILKPILGLGIVAGTSILWTNPNHTRLRPRLVLTINVAILILVNFSYLIFLPFGLNILTSQKPNLNETTKTSSNEDTPNKHLLIKMTVPFLVALAALLSKIKIFFSMGNQFVLIIHELLLLERNLRYPMEKLTQEKKYLLYFSIGMLLYSFPIQISSVLIKQDPMNFFLFTLGVYFNFSTFSFEMQFCILAILTTRRLADLNRQITQLLSAKSIVLIEQTQRRLRELKIVHEDLKDVVQMTIDYFNVSILISLFCAVVNSFMNAYFAIFGGFKDAGSKETVSGRSIFEIIAHSVYVVYYFVRFWFICAAADRMMGEVGNTKMCLAEALNNNLSRELQKEVKRFYIYASARKMKFMICGLFKLEISVVTTAIATSVTYLVVLMQFHKL